MLPRQRSDSRSPSESSKVVSRASVFPLDIGHMSSPLLGEQGEWEKGLKVPSLFIRKGVVIDGEI